ncbi:MAG: ATP-dependent Clp protease ATP-binding subunit ClpC, partial [Oscillospiraceae bacterium]|nr:ATP-dependent Clp protease ATP-binding subunit ClpC [Oscillospiraceae bacterium]
MYKFTGFTQKANAALNASIECAENMGHTYIGSEHLLLGLLAENGGIAYTVLSSKKLTAGKVEDEIKNMVGLGVPTVLTPNDFTPRCKNIIDGAMAQARAMGHSYVGTEHLLISLIKEGSGAAVSIMARLGVSSQEVLQELLKALGSSNSKGSCPQDGSSA